MSNLVLLGRNLLEKGLNKFVKLMISFAWKVSKMLTTTIKYLEIFERKDKKILCMGLSIQKAGNIVISFILELQKMT